MLVAVVDEAHVGGDVGQTLVEGRFGGRNACATRQITADGRHRRGPGRTKNHELHTLLPWHWRPDNALVETAA